MNPKPDLHAIYLARRPNSQSFQDAKARSKPVVDDLVNLGFDVALVSDLYNGRMDYGAAFPVLLHWLPLVDDKYIKLEIIHALTTKWARPVAVPVLLEEFRRLPDDIYGTPHVKWAIGRALEVLAGPDDFADLASIARDKKHGQARQKVVYAFWRMKDPRAVSVLIAVLDDADVAGHAFSALAGLAPPSARPHFLRFAQDPRPWWRKTAQRAIAKIDKKLANERPAGDNAN
ncbi:MAG: HEAT repeat domain-containing protein [Chloroflexota bacterium]